METKFDNLPSQNTSQRPLIIVTNDDGFDAKGFLSLLKMIGQYGDVLAVAPDTGKSGMSHALTFKMPVRLTLISEKEGEVVYKLTGTPVDCLKMALDKLIDRKPSLVVSGINHGSNASISSIYSGTVAGAREGGLNGIPSIAFSSLDFASDAEFEAFTPMIQSIIENVMEKGLPENTFLNVNFPCEDIPNLKGLKVCRQAKGVWVEEFVKRKDPIGQDYYWLTGYFSNHEPDATDTDEYWLSQNYGTVVPVQIEVTAMDAIETLTNWNL